MALHHSAPPIARGSVQLAYRLGIAPSTAHRILTTVHLNRLSHVDRPQGERNRAATPDKPRNKYSSPLMGKAHVHTVIDDHSRVAYAEIHDNETGVTAVLVRAVEWFNQRGVTVERVLSDNGTSLARHLRGAQHHTQAHPPLPTSDRRQDRTVSPHPGGRLGIPPLLHLRGSVPRRTGRVTALLQPPPPAFSLRKPAAFLAIDQRPRSVHLGGEQRGQGVERGDLPGDQQLACLLEGNPAGRLDLGVGMHDA